MERFALIEVSGKQFRVKEGDRITVDMLLGQEGQEITLDRVLAYGDGKGLATGKPYLEGVSVIAIVEGAGKSRKVRAFKYKRRTRSSRRSLGHRQDTTRLLIKSFRGV